MRKGEKIQRERIGKHGHLNENCWLVKTLNYAPYKRCQYCGLKFRNCMFLHYQITSLILISFFLTLSFLIKGSISELTIISVFALVIIYGYFFNKSTDKLIQANFAQRKAKEALEELTKKLEEKVDAQTHNLKAKNLHLQKLLKMRSEFLDIASHQLRTPVSVINGTLSMMKEGDLDNLPKEKQQTFLDNIYRKGIKLQEIIDDILSASEMDTTEFTISNFKEMSIETIINEVIKDKKPEANSKGLKLVYKKPALTLPSAKLNEKYLEQALTNLVDNAIKYTEKGSVEIGAEVKDKNLLLSVKDSGIGVPKEDLPKLFKKFIRAKNAREVYTDGSGLGLFIVKQIVEAHGGQVWAESPAPKSKQGSIFYIQLPLKT